VEEGVDDRDDRTYGFTTGAVVAAVTASAAAGRTRVSSDGGKEGGERAGPWRVAAQRKTRSTRRIEQQGELGRDGAGRDRCRQSSRGGCCRHEPESQDADCDNHSEPGTGTGGTAPGSAAAC